MITINPLEITGSWRVHTEQKPEEHCHISDSSLVVNHSFRSLRSLRIFRQKNNLGYLGFLGYLGYFTFTQFTLNTQFTFMLFSLSLCGIAHAKFVQYQEIEDIFQSTSP